MELKYIVYITILQLLSYIIIGNVFKYKNEDIV